MTGKTKKAEKAGHQQANGQPTVITFSVPTTPVLHHTMPKPEKLVRKTISQEGGSEGKGGEVRNGVK